MFKRRDAKTLIKMDKIINLGIPHIGEQIFESIETEGLIEFLKVSETWKNLAENVLIKRWKGKIYEACDRGKTKVVQLLLEHCDADESGLNIKYNHGFTALIVACHNGRKDVVQLLLNNSESNIDLNARTNQGCTGLMLAWLVVMMIQIVVIMILMVVVPIMV